MSDLKTISLDDLISSGQIELGRGEIISKDDIQKYPGQYPIYSSSASSEGKFGEYGKYIFDEELISWSIDGGGNFFYRPKHKFSVTNVSGYLRIKNNKQNYKFLYYSLVEQHRYFTFDYMTKAHPSVIRKMYHVPLISEEYQNKIATILSTIDETIIHTEALIEKYQHIKAGMMNDLFTRGVLPDGTLRPTRDEAPELYHETPIGWIPKEWKIRTIQSLTDNNSAITIGPFGSDLVASDYRTDGVPVVFVRDVKENGFVWNSNTYVEYRKAQKLSSHTVKSGDILSTKMGLPPCISCIYPEWMDEGIITADIVRLRPNIRNVNSQWLTSTLNFDRSKRQVAAITAGVTRPKITLGDYRKLLIALPKIEEQNLIALKIEKIQLLLNAEKKIHTNLLNQKSGLMHDLLTGEVRVKPDQE